MLVGLGNPGREYERNRHNVGFMVVDRLCDSDDSLAWTGASRFRCELAKGTLGRRQVVLARPHTFMNLSGRCVGPLARFYRVPAQRIVVIHDDVDLALGRLKVKAGGGDGGHKGLRSTAQELGSSEFIRIRFGVGRPRRGEVADHVLSDFYPDEEKLRDDSISRAAKAARAVITRGVKEAMNRFNTTPRPSKDDKDKAASGPREEQPGEGAPPSGQPEPTTEPS